jgi:hypothetical protein
MKPQLCTRMAGTLQHWKYMLLQGLRMRMSIGYGEEDPEPKTRTGHQAQECEKDA